MKVVATNRKARRNYQITDTYEVGIELKGNEVKSLRTRSCSIDESFARLERGEVFLYNMHIPEFAQSSYFSADPRRIRKLLLHKKEIHKIFGSMTQRGLTLVPLKVYFNERGLAKIQLGIARGLHNYDKRRKIKENIANREADRAMKNFNRSG